MATRSLNVVITGDSKGIGIAARETEGHFRAIQRSAKLTGTAVKAGFALGAAGALVGVTAFKKVSEAAKDAEASHARMTAQLKASGISYRAHAKEIDNVIQKTSKLAALDDEDLQDAFTNIVRSTGSVSKGLQNIGLAADIARAKHIDVAKAGQLVGKVATGNVTALARYGIQIDKNATSQEALAELQKRFAGQAEAYGKTAAGAQDRFGVAVENLEEKLGGKLLPVFAKVTNAVATFVGQIDSGKGAGGRFANAVSEGFNRAKNAVHVAVRAIQGFLHDNREDIRSVEKAVRNVATAIKAVIDHVLIPAFKILLPAIKGVVDGILTSLRGLIRFVSGVLTGDWRKAWEGIKDAVRGNFKVIVSIVKGSARLLAAAAEAAGKGIAKGIISGLGSLGHLILDKLKDALHFVGDHIPKINLPFGIGGDGLGVGSIPGLGGGGSLMGADPDLQPFANLASSMGLHTSSGIRPGATTLSGNTSYHSSGDAIDEVGPFGAMKRYASTLFHTAGGRLRELISPFPQFNIKDGHPYRYPANIVAQHSGGNAHVHVAYTGPFGDGIGQAVQAARAAGFRGEALVDAVAIAGAETGFRAGAMNLKYPDHSIGMWQINQLAHHGRYGSDAALKDPFANARAAWAISGHGRSFAPWSTWPGAASGWLARARAAVKAVGGSGGGGSGGGSSKPKPIEHGRVTAGGDFRQPTAGHPSEDIQHFLHPRPLKGGGPSKGFLEGQRPPASDTDTGDPNQALIDAQNAAAEAAEALRQELAAVRASIDAQTDFAKAVKSTNEYQLTKSLADLVSGRIVGYGVAGRAFTPGTGVEYAY